MMRVNSATFLLWCMGLCFGLILGPITSAQPAAPSTPPLAPGSAPPATSAAEASADASIEQKIEASLEPFIYDPKGRRDPFRPFVEVRAPEEGELAGPMLPLQQYDLDQLRLIGIIWDVTDPKAMFVDPRQQVHIVRRDERIGRRNGYVAVIREGEVVVVETVNINGDLMYSTRVLRLAAKSANPGAR